MVPHLSAFFFFFSFISWRLITLQYYSGFCHSSTLAWKIPWMEEPGGRQSPGSLRVGLD